MRFNRVGTITVACAVVACTSAGSMSTSVPSMTFDTLFVYSSEVGDTSLLQPEWLVASEAGVLVGDASTARLTFLNQSGEVEWIYAARGQGPLELLMPFDAVFTESEIWVLDSSSRKILRLTHHGEPTGSVSLPDLGGIPAQIERLEHGHALVLTHREALARIDPNSWRLEHLQPITWATPPPEDWLSQTTVSAGDGQVVVGMRFGPEIVVLRDGEAPRYPASLGDVPYRRRTRRQVVDGMSFPTEASEAIYGAANIAITDGQIFVLRGGSWREEVRRSNNLVVELDRDGAYRRTHVIPFGAGAMDAIHDIFYFIVDREPTIVALRARYDERQ